MIKPQGRAVGSPGAKNSRRGTLSLPPFDQLDQDGRLSHEGECLLSGEPLFIEQCQHILHEFPLDFDQVGGFCYRVFGRRCLWMCAAQLREGVEDLLLVEPLLEPEGFDYPRLFPQPRCNEVFDGSKIVGIKWISHGRTKARPAAQELSRIEKRNRGGGFE